MAANLFTRDQPASSIGELVAYLASAHQDNYIYRGQTKDYGSIIPSLFRRMNLTKDGDYFLRPKDHVSSRLETLKVTILYSMITKYGNVVGQYLTQQYLASSTCVDVTENINVAAFFATMSYPEYNSVVPLVGIPGVIYRFDKNQFSNLMAPFGAKSNPYAVDAMPGEYEVFTAHSTVEHHKIRDINATGFSTIDSNKTYYLLEEHLMSFAHVKPFLDELDHNHKQHHPNASPDWSMFSRPRAQHGGIIQPKFLCQHPEDPNQEPNSSQDMIGFEDLYGKYGMTPFYFIHNGQSSGNKRELLWPSMWEDGVFGTLCLMMKFMMDKGMLGIDAELKDLVDIGYLGNPHLQFSDELNEELAALFAQQLK